jgi:MFS family permease
MAALLGDRSFFLFFSGKAVSLIGMWMQNVSAAVLMYALTGSAVMVAVVSLAQYVPILLFTLWGGALADRYDRRRLLIIGRLVTGVAITGLGLLLVVAGPGTGGPPALLVAVCVAGCGWAFSMAPIQAVLPMLVPKRDLEAALALNSVGPAVGRTAGPAIGAVLLVVASPAVAFLVSGLCQLLFAAMLALVVVPRVQRTTTEKPSVWGGLRYLREDRRTARLIVGMALITFGADAVLTLSPSMADHLDGGDEAVGLFTTAFGVGSLLLVFVFRRIRGWASLRVTAFLGYWTLALGLVVAAVSPDVWLASLGFGVQGLGFMMASVALNADVQGDLPEEVRGRVMALWAGAFLGTRPFAALWSGVLTETLGVRLALVISAAAVGAASWTIARPEAAGAVTGRMERTAPASITEDA